MKISLAYKGDEEFVSQNNNGNQVTIDMRSPERKHDQNPTELLLSALGACAAVEIVSMVKKRRRTFVDLKAEISGERRDEHPKGFVQVHLQYFIHSPDLTDREAQRIVELATTKYCSVAASISAVQTHAFEVVRS